VGEAEGERLELVGAVCWFALRAKEAHGFLVLIERHLKETGFGVYLTETVMNA